MDRAEPEQVTIDHVAHTEDRDLKVRLDNATTGTRPPMLNQVLVGQLKNALASLSMYMEHKCTGVN